MLNYSLPAGLPAGSRAVWSQLTLEPLAPGVLTPFSYSVISEIAGRAWYQLYDRLGFNPMPKARIMRQHMGRAYFNLTMSAQREAESAGVEPITLLIDGQPFPVCKVEKAGFLAGLKTGLNERKLERLMRSFADESETTLTKAQAWWGRVRDFRWSQAEILLIMEEIEPVSATPFSMFLAARQTIDLACNRLLRTLPEGDVLILLDGLTAAPPALLEDEVFSHLNQMAQQISPAARAWLATGRFQDWVETLPDAGVRNAMQSFLARFGHYSSVIGEVRLPRWQEDPSPLFRLLADGWETAGAKSVALETTDALLARLDAPARKQAQESLQQIRQALPVQSRALSALAYLLAGTRRWALAAAREAMSDRRLLDQESVFMFELEEVKQMMTGEWNISDTRDIQATAQKRIVGYNQWCAADAPVLMVGESPASAPQPVHLPEALNPLRRLTGKPVSERREGL
jgi:hypothetical protein